MKLRIVSYVIIALFIFMTLIAWGAEPKGPYLFEQLRKPAYNKSFNALFKGRQDIEPWLEGYIRTRNGVDTPSETRTIGDKNYEFYEICQPHNCPRNVIYVIIEPGGAHAWAYFTKDDGTSRFFGNPDAQTQDVLKSLVNN
jgi:hypothetical protein